MKNVFNDPRRENTEPPARDPAPLYDVPPPPDQDDRGGYEEAGATWWLAQADDVAGVRKLIATGPP
jgi:hypothetical protein